MEDLSFDERGLAKRGLLVRHLVMPGGLAGSQAILRFLAGRVSPHAYVNVMAQYRPAGEVSPEAYPALDRLPTRAEISAALQLARELGLRLDARHE